jgi:CARDB protein
MLTCHQLRALTRLLLFAAPLLTSCVAGSDEVQRPDAPSGPDPVETSDLSAQPIDAPSHVQLDSLLAMRIGVRNEGPRTAGPGWFIRLYLSSDASIDSGDTLIDQFVTTRELPPLGEDRYLRTMKLQASIVPGTYYLGSMLDVTQVVPETNEDNNTLRAPATITITATSSPES